MAKKKHCDRHYRFVATCPDCQAQNNGPDSSGDRSSNRLYGDIDGDHIEDEIIDEPPRSPRGRRRPEIPNMGGGDPSDRPPRRPSRFRYDRLAGRANKRVLFIVLILAVLGALVVGLYAYPLWHAKITLQNQLYENKSDIDYWALYTLNFWSTDFFFNKIGFLGAFIGAIIMTIPPEDNVLAMLGTKFGWGRPSKKKSVIFWWTIGFGIFFILAQGMETGYFALTMYMMETGALDVALGDFFNAFGVLSDPASVDMVDMFIYNAVTYPILMYLCTLVLFRLIFNVINYGYMIKNSFRAGASICFIVADFFMMGLFGMVLSPVNGIDLIRVYSVIFGVVAFIVLGIGFYIYGNHQNHLGNYEFNLEIKKKSLIAVIFTVFIILMPVFFSVPQELGVQSNRAVWEELEWNVSTTREIEWSRQAAGIDIGDIAYFETHDILDYSNNVTTSDENMLGSIRQYDKEISAKKMVKYIRSPNATMADSDIIYVEGHGEYWVAPKTLQMDAIEGSSVSAHTELYDHVNGFIALDTSTGEMVNDTDYETIFGVSGDYPIFFGEGEDTTYTGGSGSDFDDVFGSSQAFQHDILLNTGWESANSYNSTPDGSLTGLEAFWFTMDMGLTDYALDGTEKEYLINRNIRDRVGAVLLPGMVIDEDPYLVFDRENKVMYYALSIYTSLEIGSYAKSPMYRFLGVVLVDVQTGVLSWYANPNMPLPKDDPLSALWKVYTDDEIFPWEATPDWLLPQLRYPENLWEKQMTAHFKYHVTDPNTWKKGNEFFEEATGGDVFYIESDLGDGLEFIGANMVEYDIEDTEKLAGLYVMRHGANFGKTIFYSSTDLYGPETARKQFQAAATEELTLIENERYGNILLYPLAGSLYYFIPVYTSTSDYEDQRKAAFINAFHNDEIFWGDDINEAYASLNETLTPAEEELEEEKTDPELGLSVTDLQEVDYSENIWAEFRVLVEYLNTSAIAPQRNLRLNLTIQTSSSNEINVSLFGSLKSGFEYVDGSKTRFNFTITEWSNPNGLYPGEGRVLMVKLTPETLMSNPDLTIGYKFDLIDIDSGEFEVSTGWRELTWTNPDWAG